MKASYDFTSRDAHWQQRWEEEGLYRADDSSKKKKYYCLIEFPYPSGDGLHIGHIRSNTAMDIIARKRRAEGYNVLYPIGWDAFGLPTENYAIKTGIHPKIVTKQNTDTFRKQLQSMGFSFDWSREINTTDSAYYTWTQWIFIQLFKEGLAYKKKSFINFCPKDKTGLANEEVIDGKCERCGTETEKREREQWFLAITKYADRLDKDLDDVEYLEPIKIQQRNWIGRSVGSEIEFKLNVPRQDSEKHAVTVFTTRPDTLFGATYLAISAGVADSWLKVGWSPNENVKAFIKETLEAEGKRKPDDELLEKKGVDSGVTALNPATNEEIPVWIANYVVSGYGTGAIMAVPAHDERDFEFAQQYELPIVKVIEAKADEECYTGEGVLINSGKFDGISSGKARKAITKAVKGKETVTYKLRDWLFSRQRYWGEPIPMVHCEKCDWVPIPESELPLELPDVDDFQPTDTGESPLATVTDWVKTTCPSCKGPARRETDTMPNWAGSSWYYLRYTDPENDSALASKKSLKYFTPVDWYNGGMEHTTLHLLYSRFWHKFLYDIGVVPTKEPYMKRTAHGLILAEGGVKMSKSKGNVINPDTIVAKYGADTLRVYEMFIGPFNQAIAWNDNDISGSDRFLKKLFEFVSMFSKTVTGGGDDKTILAVLHTTIQKVGDDIESMSFNTALSQLMICLNELRKMDTSKISRSSVERLIIICAPFAPHMTEELWHMLGKTDSVHVQAWPKAEKKYLVRTEIEIPVQINGKVRAKLSVTPGVSEKELVSHVEKHENTKKWLAGKSITKIIYIQDKILNIVVSD